MQKKQANDSLDLAKSTSCIISSENTAINKTIMALFNFNYNAIKSTMNFISIKSEDENFEIFKSNVQTDLQSPN